MHENRFEQMLHIKVCILILFSAQKRACLCISLKTFCNKENVTEKAAGSSCVQDTVEVFKANKFVLAEEATPSHSNAPFSITD